MKKRTCSILMAALTLSLPGIASADAFTDMLFGDQQVARPKAQATPKPALSQMEQEDQDAIMKFRKQPPLHLPYLIAEETWTPEIENEFGDFVHQLGQAVHDKKCGTVTSCLRNPEFNKFAKNDPPGMVLYSDCADFPYFLRAYFAWHRQLPFSYVTSISVSPRPYASMNDQDDGLAKADLETSPYGNVMRDRGGSNVPVSDREGMNFITYIQRMFDTVSTRTYRSGALTPGHNLSDLYPVTLDKNGIGPGTVVSANGHAMIIWNVEKSGTIRIIDGHPGAYVQEHLLDASKLQRSRPDHGFGFFRFRPLTLVGAEFGANGLYGGKLVSTSDAVLYSQGLLSLDQWFGPGSNVAPGSQVSPNAWKQAFKTVGFWDYLTAQLRDENTVVGAEEAVTTSLGEICHTLQERAKSYDSNLAAGLPFTPHPESLPANIFGAKDAVWELRSSPGGDARIKDAVRNTVRTAIAQYRIAKSGSKNVVFAGDARAFSALLRQKLSDLNSSCTITYTNSARQRVNLSLNQVLSRLNRLSFDPYMCPEKSWGASGDEMASCRDADTDGWYEAEANIRNTVGKQDEDSNYVVRSDRPITLSMLRDSRLVDLSNESKISLGTKTPPKYMNLDKIFASDEFIGFLDGKEEKTTVTQEIKTQEIKTQEPKTQEPKVEKPKAQEPKVVKPKTQKPKAEKPQTSSAKGNGIAIKSIMVRDMPFGAPLGFSTRIGQRIEILSTEDLWARIRMTDGRTGWVPRGAVKWR